MEKRLRANLLFDLYGKLMTDKRSEALRLYLEEDLSYSEIAEITGVSRQAVHDAVLRAEKRLEEYEEALGLLRARDDRRAALSEALSDLERARARGGSEEALERARETIRKIRDSE